MAQESIQGRIVVIDLLRAVALFGIVLTHAEMGFHAGPPPGEGFMSFHRLDELVSTTISLLVEGKFFIVFSFLFGLSFALQLDSATKRGNRFSARFAWRLCILFCIGLLHQLLFNGDILMIYALLGLLLIACRFLPTRVLLVAGLTLYLNAPVLIMNVDRISRPASSDQLQAQSQTREAFMGNATRLYAANRSGSPKELMHVNLTAGLAMKARYQLVTGRLWVTFGCFLLGMVAGRCQLFVDTPLHRRLFARMLWCGSTLVCASAILAAAYPGSPLAASYSEAWGYFAAGVFDAALALVYVCAITLMFWIHPRRWMERLSGVGRIGLTTYLMQTVIGVMLFFGIGLGLLGEIGSAAAAGLGALIFLVQIVFARWWLSRFSLGPMEWIWRSLTSFAVQPNSFAESARTDRSAI